MLRFDLEALRSLAATTAGAECLLPLELLVRVDKTHSSARVGLVNCKWSLLLIEKVLWNWLLSTHPQP